MNPFLVVLMLLLLQPLTWLQVKSNCISTPMLLVLHAFTCLYWVVTVIMDVAIGRCRHCYRQLQRRLWHRCGSNAAAAGSSSSSCSSRPAA
jgi:hypothetical protein